MDQTKQTKTKAYKGPAMEGPIARWYARITLKDLGRHKGMAERMVKRIPPGDRVLEVAPGPGYFCIELAKLGNFQITGLDISKSFVEMAQKNAAEAGVKAEFRVGDAANMPFQDQSFDFIFCQAAFKNFTRPVQAIAEMYRCLRPGGLAVIEDLRRDATLKEIDREVAKMGLGPINEMFTRWTFRSMLLKNAYSVAEMEAFIARTPFGSGTIQVSGIGFEALLER